VSEFSPSRLCVHPFDPLSARCGRHERIRKVLCFPRNLVATELHDAHGTGGLAVIGQDEFGDPKITVANPAMIKAYKAGIPGNGQPFPDGSMIVKLQWKPKKSTEAQFAVDVPDVFSQAFVMEKDSKRFPKSGGWGYAVFNYDAVSDKFTPDPKSLSDCGNTCHTVVKAKDYIFHPYQKR
jgi:hypothetical protein